MCLNHKLHVSMRIRIFIDAEKYKSRCKKINEPSILGIRGNIFASNRTFLRNV